MDLAWLGLTELKTMLDDGRLSSVELTDSLLARIAQAEPHLHACVEIYADAARALARAADQARSAGLPRSPLHGIPVLLKDLLDIEGRVCTLGSQRNLNRIATQTAATVERLLAAGMIPLGKTHMTEFAFGGWGISDSATIPGTWRRSACPAARPAAPAWRSPPVMRRSASAATPAARCASRRPSMA
jgi:aspartyl-tRNA(Asn)/glutamyl-tRNA(Gln) amidotransferase subunit A